MSSSNFDTYLILLAFENTFWFFFQMCVLVWWKISIAPCQNLIKNNSKQKKTCFTFQNSSSQRYLGILWVFQPFSFLSKRENTFLKRGRVINHKTTCLLVFNRTNINVKYFSALFRFRNARSVTFTPNITMKFEKVEQIFSFRIGILNMF